MPRRVVRSPLFWTLVTTVVVFGALRWALSEDSLIQLLNYALVAVAFALTLGYMPEVWLAIREKRFTMLGIYAVGVGLIWFAILFNRSWAILVRVVNADWMRTSPVVSTYLFIFVVAGLLQLAAPGVVDGRVPRRNMIRLGLVLGTAVGVFIFVWSLGYGDTGFS